jgi:transcriptional regulator with XRE-family HTH domain
MTQISSPLGKRVQDRRKELGLSIRALAERISKSPTFIVLLEKEPTPPSSTDEVLDGLALALSLPVDELFALARRLPKAVSPRSAEEVALFRSVQSLSAEDKKKLLQSLKRNRGG